MCDECFDLQEALEVSFADYAEAEAQVHELRADRDRYRAECAVLRKALREYAALNGAVPDRVFAAIDAAVSRAICEGNLDELRAEAER